MVVLLAIAGTVAAVLVNRAGTETDRLENQTDSAVYGITNKTACQIGGHTWHTAAADPAGHVAGLNAARPDGTWTAGTNVSGWCQPSGS